MAPPKKPAFDPDAFLDGLGPEDMVPTTPVFDTDAFLDGLGPEDMVHTTPTFDAMPEIFRPATEQARAPQTVTDRQAEVPHGVADANCKE